MKLLNISLKALVMVAAVFLFGSMLASAASLPDPALWGTGLAAACLIPQGKQFKGALFTITAADVVTEFGAFYRPEGQSTVDLVSTLMQRSVTAAYFPTRLTEQTLLRKASTSFARVLQRFQKGFTPVGGTTFEPKTIQLYKLKIDLQETPDDLEETWLGFLADNSLKRQDWPFIKWYLDNALKRADQDLELNEIFYGVPGAITPGTATVAGTSLLGIKKTINTIDGAGTGDKQVLGATPSDPVDFVDYVEAFFGALDPLLQNELVGDYIFMSIANKNLFRDGMRIKYNTYYNQVGDADITTLRNYNVQLIGLPSMVGSNKIWATPKWNRQAGFKKPGNEMIFQVENVDRTVKAYTDYFKGFGFWLEQYVVYNDVELT